MKFRLKEGRLARTVSFSSAIAAIIEESGLKESLIEEKIRSGWSSIAGDIIAGHSIPGKIFHGILYVSVDHAVYSSELSLMKNTLIIKIRDFFGYDVIRDIRVKVRRLDWKEKRS